MTAYRPSGRPQATAAIAAPLIRTLVMPSGSLKKLYFCPARERHGDAADRRRSYRQPPDRQKHRRNRFVRPEYGWQPQSPRKWYRPARRCRPDRSRTVCDIFCIGLFFKTGFGQFVQFSDRSIEASQSRSRLADFLAQTRQFARFLVYPGIARTVKTFGGNLICLAAQQLCAQNVKRYRRLFFDSRSALTSIVTFLTNWSLTAA